MPFKKNTNKKYDVKYDIKDSFFFLCNECCKETKHTTKVSLEEKGSVDIDEDFWINWYAEYQIVECQGCGTISFIERRSDSENMETTEAIYPQRGQTKKIETYSLPQSIASIYFDTMECYNNNFAILCAAGLRAIIECLCVDKNIDCQSLKDKIDALSKNDVITKHQAGLLHKLRFMGNEALHNLKRPTKNELQKAVKIINNTLEHVYTLLDEDS